LRFSISCFINKLHLVEGHVVFQQARVPTKHKINKWPRTPGNQENPGGSSGGMLISRRSVPVREEEEEARGMCDYWR